MDSVENLQNRESGNVTLHSTSCQCRGYGSYLDPGPIASQIECSHHNDQNLDGARTPIMVPREEWVHFGKPRTREAYEELRDGSRLRIVKRSCSHAQLSVEYRSPPSGNSYVVAKCIGCPLSGPNVDAGDLSQDVATRAMEPIVQITGHNYKWIQTTQPKSTDDDIDLIVYFQSCSDGAMV